MLSTSLAYNRREGYVLRALNTPSNVKKKAARSNFESVRQHSLETSLCDRKRGVAKCHWVAARTDSRTYAAAALHRENGMQDTMSEQRTDTLLAIGVL